MLDSALKTILFFISVLLIGFGTVSLMGGIRLGWWIICQ